MAHISCFNMGKFGNVVRVDMGPNVPLPKLPRVILVMDCSGSMGDYVSATINGWFPNAMIAAGYDPLTPAEIITFSDFAEELKYDNKIPTLKQLRNEYKDAQNNTRMSYVFELLKKKISKATDRIVIIAVSDGEIQDSSACRANAECVAAACQSATIETCMIRFKTGSSQPDTGALACIGLLSQTYVIHEVIANASDVQSKFASIIKQATQPQFRFTVHGTGLQRLPGSALASSLAFSASPAVFLSVPSHPTCYTIEYDGAFSIVAAEEQKELDQSTMDLFCEIVHSAIRLRKVINLSVDSITVFFTELRDLLQTTVAHEAAQPNIKQRLKQLIQQTKKSHKQCINDVLMAANEQKVANLNKEQQAAYLRETTSRDLARRTGEYATKRKEQVEFVPLLKLPASDSGEYSFFSGCTTLDALRTVSADEDAKDAPLLALVRLIGYVGCGYVAHRGDYVDPWSFRIQQLFLPCIASSDLREVNSILQNGECAKLCSPGSTAPLTGVVPIRYMQPEVWAMIPKAIAEAHTSINLRGMLAPVHNDALGERMAVLIWIAEQRSRTEWMMKIWRDVVAQVQDMVRQDRDDFAALVDGLQSCDPNTTRLSFIGENGVSNLSKILAACLVLHPLKDRLFVPTLQLVYEFDCYHAARRYYKSQEDKRDQALRAVFKLGENDDLLLQRFPVKEMPEFEEDEKDGGAPRIFEQIREHADHCAELAVVSLNGAILTSFPWLPSEEFYSNFRQCMSESVSVNPLFTESESTTRWNCILAALYCSEETQRLNKTEKKMLTFEWYDKELVWIQSVARRIYAKDYIKHLNAEQKRREAKFYNRQIYLMVTTPHNQEFVELLQKTVPNRQHCAYEKLLSDLVAQQDPGVEKLMILLIGKYINQDHAWSLRDSFDVEFRRYEKFFPPHLWQMIVDHAQQCDKYQYRASDKPNAHGHCNSNPSDWALSGEWKKKKPWW